MFPGKEALIADGLRKYAQLVEHARRLAVAAGARDPPAVHRVLAQADQRAACHADDRRERHDGAVQPHRLLAGALSRRTPRARGRRLLPEPAFSAGRPGGTARLRARYGAAARRRELGARRGLHRTLDGRRRRRADHAGDLHRIVSLRSANARRAWPPHRQPDRRGRDAGHRPDALRRAGAGSGLHRFDQPEVAERHGWRRHSARTCGAAERMPAAAARLVQSGESVLVGPERVQLRARRASLRPRHAVRRGMRRHIAGAAVAREAGRPRAARS